MKTVLIFSGGMDSTTLLYDLINQGDEVFCLLFDYCQRHYTELDHAERLCRFNKIQSMKIRLPNAEIVMSGSSQTSKKIDVPEGNYDEPSMIATVVPNRNMVMLAYAGSYAISHKYDRLAYGAHAGDHTIYPDCRPEFVEAMAKAFSICDWQQLQLYTPYLNMTKGEICKKGIELKVPYGSTYTCYKGKFSPCGKCGSCRERADAFAFAGIPDPALISGKKVGVN